MTGWILRHLATLQGRIGTGLLTILAGVNLARPGSAWFLQWESLAAFLAAFATWLVAEFQGAGTPYPHDVRLFSKILDLIDDRERHFLRTHEFHEAFSRECMKGLREITHWGGAAYTFLDSKMQKQWAPLKARIEFR